MQQTLTKNYEEVIANENELHAFGVIVADEPTKESNDMSKRSKAFIRNTQKKETIDI